MPVLGCVAVAGAVAGLGSVRGSDSEPASLISTQPAAGARLAVPPGAVTLVFSDQLDPGRSHVQVVGPDGYPRTVGPAVVSGEAMVQPVRIRDEGVVRVGYHAVLRDGRELTGEQSFVVATVAPAPAPPADAEAVTGHTHATSGPLAALTALVGAGTGTVVIWLAMLGARPRTRSPGPGPGHLALPVPARSGHDDPYG